MYPIWTQPEDLNVREEEDVKFVSSFCSMEDWVGRDDQWKIGTHQAMLRSSECSMLGKAAAGGLHFAS